MTWNTKCKKLLRWSEKYVSHQENPNHEMEIIEQWEVLINNSKSMWEKLVRGCSVVIEIGNQADHEEEEILDQEAMEYAEGNPDYE
jgi:hypothetical protein